MLIDFYATVNSELPDDGEFLIDKDGRDELIGYLGNLYDSVSFQKTSENIYLVKYSNKRK